MARAPKQRPLFIPLKTEYFRAFENGSQSEELRRYGPRWNERTCTLGRPATLSHGYSGKRLKAVVIGFERRTMTTDTYGPDGDIAVIRLSVEQTARRSKGSQ
jgi:hypothetical protein